MGRNERLIGISTLALLAACSPRVREGIGSGGDITAGGSTAGTGEPDATSGQTSGVSGDDSGPGTERFDIGGGDTMGSGGDEGAFGGCQRVDFLFVIDNSGSMDEEQAALTASFPQFISEIMAVVQAQDYHIMLVDTDEAANEGGCPGAPGDEALCADWCTMCWAGGCDDCKCAGSACPSPPTCDISLGAGKIVDEAGNPCGIAGDSRFMTEAQPNLSETFACLGQVGIHGSGDERAMQASIEAITTLNAPGGCNEGFLRDDAILVVVIVTDEPDITSIPATAMEWRDAMVTAKNGNEEAVVALAVLYNTPGATCPAPTNDEAPAPKITEWALSFTHGSIGDSCAADYAPFFSDAVSIIDVACEDFVPPG